MVAGGTWLAVKVLGQQALVLTPGEGSFFWLYVVGFILMQAVFGALYFLVTDWMMKNRLNLE